MTSATVRPSAQKEGRGRIRVRLLIQPEDGVQPLIKAISSAKSRIEIAIFRFDQKEIETALGAAVSRGVAVHALIASKNRAGEENLRALELRLLGAGVTVARTGEDLVRYHGKMMIVDRRELYLLAFNLTHIDMERSRSFGIITRSADMVREAAKLFEADTHRVPYVAGSNRFLVSPVNARQELTRFLGGAKKELLIYDPQVSDRAMVALLQERVKAGVQVRVLGRMLGSVPGLRVCKLGHIRLHTRSIVRDGTEVFVGSQSLRELELDARREVGVLVRDPKVVSAVVKTFEADWEKATAERDKGDTGSPGERIAKKVAKAVAREIPAVAPIVTGAVQEVVGELRDMNMIPEEVEALVKGAVKEAVKDVVRTAVESTTDESREAK